jgi:hypothetical protein
MNRELPVLLSGNIIGRSHTEGTTSAAFNCIRQFCSKHDFSPSFYLHTWEDQPIDKLPAHCSFSAIDVTKRLDIAAVIDQCGLEPSIFERGINRSGTHWSNCSISSVLSQFYSRTRACKLLADSFLGHQAPPESFLLCRFDVGVRGALHLRVPTLPGSISKPSIILPAADFQEEGLADLWMFSSTTFLQDFTQMYDLACEALKPHSSYISQFTKTGWPGTSGTKRSITKILLDFKAGVYSPICFSDRPISRSALLPIESRKSTYPTWLALNAHALFKFFLLRYNLYNSVQLVTC